VLGFREGGQDTAWQRQVAGLYVTAGAIRHSSGAGCCAARAPSQRLAPALLRADERLFDDLGTQTIELERISVIEWPYATHLFFTVRR
jgi:hypothetical protein